MPIVINELVFKGTIAGVGKQEKPSPPRRKPAGREWKSLVEACVEEVLKVLEREKER